MNDEIEWTWEWGKNEFKRLFPPKNNDELDCGPKFGILRNDMK